MDSRHKIKLTQALLSMLRPLVRLCLRYEITNAELTELVRMSYVQVAYERHNIPEIEMSVSRAAVLTGLSRKEVGRLRELLESDDVQARQSPNKAQRVIHGWLNDDEYLDRSGLPLTLPLKQKKNGIEFGSFVSLVKRYSGDVTYGAILDELNHIGVTEQPNENTVTLVNYAYVPHQNELEQVRVVATCVTDLFDTALYNIDKGVEDKRFQRQVVYSHIDASFVEELKNMSAEKAQALLEVLNGAMADAKKKSATMKSANLKRIGFGLYYFEDSSAVSKTKDNDKNSNDE